MAIRSPAVAGRFYPADEQGLRDEVRMLLEQALDRVDPSSRSDRLIKAIVAPHAGYAYSGFVAASAYAQLLQGPTTPERVVLLGPAHHFAVVGLVLPTATEFATPLGTIPVDAAAVDELCQFDCIAVADEVHAFDHALEVHLPFLQETLKRPFSVVPLLVGDAEAESVYRVLAYLWGGPETLIVISSDLSHFHSYQEACSLDASVSLAIENLLPDEIDPGQACGRIPIQGLLMQARSRGLAATTVDLRNSGDTAGSRDLVVGYGAYVFREPKLKPALSEEQRRELVALARKSLVHGAEHGCVFDVTSYDHSGILGELRATFVTLRLGEELRGCMGSSEPVRALVDDIAHNSYSAGFLDPRFGPLSVQELERIEVNISLLSPLQELSFSSQVDLLSQLRPGTDGLLIQEGHQRGTLLPSVWDIIAEPQKFLREVKKKAGLPPDYWSVTMRVFRYTTETFA